ncbi:MAG: hypothetical protein NT087_00700 [Deltaproteobacteria bacterium]|nr:hypothetical protein [Deltaproteobacteria bacterium]
MEAFLDVTILPQPDLTTCGPTCLHAVYQYYGDDIPLTQVIDEVKSLETGGTLDVFLACHALQRGYKARIYTYNLQVFDPTWFLHGPEYIEERLLAQMEVKDDAKLHLATRGYLNFLNLGGELRFADLTPSLLRKYLKRSIPVLTGLSSTYLYRSMREYGDLCEDDDVRGQVSGHFVLLCGYNRPDRLVAIADPHMDNPMADGQKYEVSIDRVICAILLGIVTYDANLLIIEPGRKNGNGRANHTVIA